MSQHTGSHKNSLNLPGEKYLNVSHWPMRRIRLLECIKCDSNFSSKEVPISMLWRYEVEKLALIFILTHLTYIANG